MASKEPPPAIAALREVEQAGARETASWSMELVTAPRVVSLTIV